MYIEAPARPQHAKYFLNDTTRPVYMMQDAVRVNIIERAIREREVCRFGLPNSGLRSHALTGKPQMLGGNIDTNGAGAVLRKLQKVTAGAAADLEHSVAIMMFEFRSFIKPGINAVAFLF